MPVVHPLPPLTTIPKIPAELPATKPKHLPVKPGWTWEKSKTWIHEPIRIHIQFPITPGTEVPIPLKIEVGGLGTFEVKLLLAADEPSAAST